MTETLTKVYTISELNTEVQCYIKQRYPGSIWVQGEIKGFNRNSHKDHVFFELCEKDTRSDKVKARITAVIFEGAKPKIEARLRNSGIDFQLQDDLEVKFECFVDLYPASGSYQVRIVDMDPAYTLGRMAQQRYVVLETLERENLLQKNKTLEIPLVPLKIGLITSYNSAAYHDFIKELAESRYAFKIFHMDARMQGQSVERDVCRGMDRLNQEDIDCIVIARGGGSRYDLSWFDSLQMGKAIAYSRLPVFTGLGHEIDLSVADLVAHTYKKTPTAVAQYLVNLVSAFLKSVDQLGDGIFQNGADRVERKGRMLLELKAGLIRVGEESTQRAHRKLQEAAWQTQQSHNRLIRQMLIHLNSISERIGLKSILWLKDSILKINRYRERLPEIARVRLQRWSSQLKILTVRRDALDPIHVLRRGYTLSLDSRGKILRHLSAARLGDIVTTVLTDGRVRSQVVEKQRTHGKELS